MWNAVSLFHSLSPLVSELGIRWFLSRKDTLGALKFRRLVAQPEPPTPSFLSETTWVEASRVAHEVGIVPEVPAWGNTVEKVYLAGSDRRQHVPVRQWWSGK
jgi:hypothetical protein